MPRNRLLEKSFPCASDAAIVAHRCVTMDASTRGNVKLPASTPEKTVVGVAVEKQSSNAVAVQIAGIAVVESDGSAVINPGDYVIPVGTTGRVKAQALSGTPAAYYNVLGMCVNTAQVAATAGLFVEVLLMQQIATAA